MPPNLTKSVQFLISTLVRFSGFVIWWQKKYFKNSRIEHLNTTMHHPCYLFFIEPAFPECFLISFTILKIIEKTDVCFACTFG